MGSLNNLIAATAVALAIPAVAVATEGPVPLGGLPGETATSLLFDGASGGFAPQVFTVPPSSGDAVLRPVTEPPRLVLSDTDAGDDGALAVVPVPGALPLLVAGLAIFGFAAARRKSV